MPQRARLGIMDKAVARLARARRRRFSVQAPGALRYSRGDRRFTFTVDIYAERVCSLDLVIIKTYDEPEKYAMIVPCHQSSTQHGKAVILAKGTRLAAASARYFFIY